MASFTNNFDVTQPPDTQAANQFGLDVRNAKLDLQQRMAAISGLDANIPTLGSDIQPTNWTGLLYFATDTSKVYQWSGSAWVDITTAVFSAVTSALVIASLGFIPVQQGTGVNQNAATIKLGWNALGTAHLRLTQNSVDEGDLAYVTDITAGYGSSVTNAVGYIRLPSMLGGILVQWGEAPGVVSGSVTFPQSYSLTPGLVISGTYAYTGLTTITTTGFTYATADSGGFVNWLAIGV
jgi:hypothetical protein